MKKIPILLASALLLTEFSACETKEQESSCLAGEQFTTHFEKEYLQSNKVFKSGIHNLILYAE